MQHHPKIFGDGYHLVDYGQSAFGLEAKHWMALQGIHGATHASDNVGLKYTWFGPGYISNMYFKMIAGKPIYRTVAKGGDLSFFGKGDPVIVRSAKGTPDGKPLPLTGW